MENEIRELSDALTVQLKQISLLKNDLIQKDYEKSDSLKKCFLGIIGALDSFEDIEEGFREKGLTDNEFIQKSSKRYDAIRKKLIRTLNEFGVTKLEFKENKLIVGYCDILETEPDSQRNNDEIISVIRNGYIRGKELIRSAQLIVVKN